MTDQVVLMLPSAPGELIDKITILQIKAERITDPARLKNVETELMMLTKVRDEHMPMTPELESLSDEMKKVNEIIWDYSDTIRELGGASDFGAEFARVSWVIHSENDKRGAIKKQINLLMNSGIIEEKSYKNWK